MIFEKYWRFLWPTYKLKKIKKPKFLTGEILGLVCDIVSINSFTFYQFFAKQNCDLFTFVAVRYSEYVKLKWWSFIKIRLHLLCVLYQKRFYNFSKNHTSLSIVAKTHLVKKTHKEGMGVFSWIITTHLKFQNLSSMPYRTILNMSKWWSRRCWWRFLTLSFLSNKADKKTA